MKTQFFDYRYYVPYNPGIQPPVGDYSLVVLARGNEQNNNSPMENTDRLLMSYRRPAFKNKGESDDIGKKIGEVSYLIHAHTITLSDDGTKGTMRSDFTAHHAFSFNKKDDIDIMFTGQVEWKLEAPSAQAVSSSSLLQAEAKPLAVSPESLLAEAVKPEVLAVEAVSSQLAEEKLSAKKAVQLDRLSPAIPPLAATPSIILTNPEKCIKEIGVVDTISAVSVLVNGKKINHGNNLATLNDGDYRVKGVIEYYKF